MYLYQFGFWRPGEEYQYFVVMAESQLDAEEKAKKELEKWAAQGYRMGHVSFMDKDKLDAGDVLAVG